VNFISRAGPEFWKLYDALPTEIQRQADKQFALFEAHPFHKSLELKPLKCAGAFWSARVTLSCRALARRRGNVFYWFWIGQHDEYERLIHG
jgi:hypothetical protein